MLEDSDIKGDFPKCKVYLRVTATLVERTIAAFLAISVAMRHEKLYIPIKALMHTYHGQGSCMLTL